jgi:short-subunit dehydrogenase involved in D-alanine esterification of teichoic acids
MDCALRSIGADEIAPRSRIVKKYPDLDCVFLNAGVQRQYDLANPNKFDIDAFHQEFNVNFSSFVNLTHAFLPLLLGKSPSPTNIVLWVTPFPAPDFYPLAL